MGIFSLRWARFPPGKRAGLVRGILKGQMMLKITTPPMMGWTCQAIRVGKFWCWHLRCPTTRLLFQCRRPLPGSQIWRFSKLINFQANWGGFFSTQNGFFPANGMAVWHPPSQNAKCHASFAKYAAKSVYLIRCLGAGGSQLGFKTLMTDWLVHHEILAIASQKIFGLYNWVVQSRPIL